MNSPQWSTKEKKETSEKIKSNRSYVDDNAPREIGVFYWCFFFEYHILHEFLKD